LRTDSFCLAAALCAVVLVPGASRAQATHAQTAVGDSTRVPAPLFTTKDLVAGTAFAASTVIMFPFDERLAKHLTNPGAQANQFFRTASTGVEWIASPGAYVIGATLYGVGRLGHWDRMADLGWHGTEAVFVADAATLILKGITGRARPVVAGDTNPTNFRFLGGVSRGNARQSFPSGHATSAFAAAAAVTAETGRWWPRSTIVVGPLMYGGATMVGLSRMYHNKHWASDVMLGAAIGTFGGWKVVQYSHAHPTRLDKVFLHVAVSPMPDGGARAGLVVAIP